ncbi:MAG: hypothetical protein ACOCZK_01540, partial [Planctomycetota bacterium]
MAVVALTTGGCGTGSVTGGAMFGDFIPTPDGPDSKLTGTYVMTVVQPLEEHGIDDDFFFLSANNWTVGDTYILNFDEQNRMVDHIWTGADVRATGGLPFVINSPDGSEWLAKEPADAEEDFIYDIEAPYPDIHTNDIFEDFLDWFLFHTWIATIVPDTRIDLVLDGLTTISNSTTGGFVIDPLLPNFGIGLEDLENGSSTLYELHQECHPIPTENELGPYAGNYAVTGIYEVENETWESPVEFDFALSPEGVIASSLTQIPFFSYIKQGTFGSVIVAQYSGPSVPASTYYPSVPPVAHEAFVDPTSLGERDKVTQHWDLVVDAGAEAVNGGNLQQSINAFPREA